MCLNFVTSLLYLLFLQKMPPKGSTKSRVASSAKAHANNNTPDIVAVDSKYNFRPNPLARKDWQRGFTETYNKSSSDGSSTSSSSDDEDSDDEPDDEEEEEYDDTATTKKPRRTGSSGGPVWESLGTRMAQKRRVGQAARKARVPRAGSHAHAAITLGDSVAMLDHHKQTMEQAALAGRAVMREFIADGIMRSPEDMAAIARVNALMQSSSAQEPAASSSASSSAPSFSPLIPTVPLPPADAPSRPAASETSSSVPPEVSWLVVSQPD